MLVTPAFLFRLSVVPSDGLGEVFCLRKGCFCSKTLRKMDTEVFKRRYCLLTPKKWRQTVPLVSLVHQTILNYSPPPPVFPCVPAVAWWTSWIILKHSMCGILTRMDICIYLHTYTYMYMHMYMNTYNRVYKYIYIYICCTTRHIYIYTYLESVGDRSLVVYPRVKIVLPSLGGLGKPLEAGADR